MINGKQFFGKWTCSQGSSSIQIDPASGVLKVAAPPADGNDRFNAYGTAAAFILQANNGLFVVASGGGYTASAQSSSPLNQYTLDTADGGAVRVKDLGIDGQGAQFYWNNANGTLNQVSTSAPPATTDFKQTIVTPSLEAILKAGLPPSPDLSWVNVAETNFEEAEKILDFNQSTLAHADFSKCRFSPQTGFDHCSGPYANFTGANVQSALFGTAHLEHADFTDANANGADFTDAFLDDAIMKRMKIRRSQNLAGASFKRTHLEGADFTGAFNIINTDFTGAFLEDVIFTGSSVTGAMILNASNLTGASLNNPGSVTIFPKMIQVNAQTNFTRAFLQKIDFREYDLSNIIFSRADLTGCKLDRTNLSNADFGYAKLDGVTFTGGISIHGTNFSNASMIGVDMTGAQMGAISQLFRVPDSSGEYPAFLKALMDGDGGGVAKVFDKNGLPLQAPVVVLGVPFGPPNTRWLVEVTNPAPNVYTVLLESIGGAQSLGVYQPTTAAVLANAFMVNAVLTGANLYGVRASGVQLYSTAGGKVNLNRAKLNGFQANNGNLGNIDLSQADLPGVNFDYAILTGANFAGAQIYVDANGGQTSFNGANLQGADFTNATIVNAVFTNAAVSVPSPLDAGAFAGVWLFGLPTQAAGLIVPELTAAAQQQFTLKTNLLPFLNTPGPVPEQLINAFKAAKVTLSPNAILTIFTQAIYWRVSDGASNYVIFEACNTDFQPALGVAPGTAFTTSASFYLPLSLQNQLANGPVAPDVAKAFLAAGHPLTSGAQMTGQQHPTSWQVVDLTTVYSMWLTLQSSISGCSSTIFVRPSLANTINAFGSVSIALSQRATVTRIKPTTGWRVNNDADNPFNPVKNYIEYQVFANDSGGLDVYGSIMRIIRMKSPTDQVFFNIPSSKTILNAAQLIASPGTVCPNSNTVSTNKTNNLPFDQWMRARFLPAPPLCIPDPSGKFNCPS